MSCLRRSDTFAYQETIFDAKKQHIICKSDYNTFTLGKIFDVDGMSRRVHEDSLSSRGIRTQDAANQHGY